MVVAEQSSVLRGVVPGFSKEAKARASPSPSFNGFAFVIVLVREYTRCASSLGRRYFKSHQQCANDSPGGAECPLFSPKQTFARGDLDSVRMSAFGHKQPSLTYEKYLKFLLE